MKTYPEPSISKRRALNPDGRQSLKLLLVHLGACGLAALAVTLWLESGFRFMPCMFYKVTGLYCLTCGATRAAYELVHLKLAESLRLNPVPVMLAVWMAYVMLCELIGLLRGARVRARGGFLYLIAVLAVAAIYCVLRNTGCAPVPTDIFR